MMNKNARKRTHSALFSDEIFMSNDRPPVQSWLLTYIDVFVLIVMIFVILVALSDFKTVTPAIQIGNTEQQQLLLEQEVTTEPTPDIPQQLTESEIQQQLNNQLEDLGLEDSIDMTVTKGYAQLTIHDNILYQSSQALLTENGQQVLQQLSPLLQQAIGLIYIEGHTDNIPINTAKYPSNWELAAARATSVLHFLTTQNIAAENMRAVSFADTQPLADNKTEQGRQQNRRVNIVIKVSDRID